MNDVEQKQIGYLTQKQRLLAILLNMTIFVLLDRFVTGEYIPATAGHRLWFLSGLGFFFLTLLSAPWFRPPRNSLVNAVASALLLSSLDMTTIQTLKIELDVFRWVIVGLTVLTGICAISAMVFADADPGQHQIRKYIGAACYRISDTLGKGELIFSPPAFISILGYY